MEVKVLESDKDFMEVSVNNITVAEILRVYLNEAGVKFAAWRKDHSDKPVVLRIENSGGAKKAISAAIKAIDKDCEKILAVIK